MVTAQGGEGKGMLTFHALSNWETPSLAIWRPNTSLQRRLPMLERDEHDFAVFRDEPDHQIHEYTHFKLCSGEKWEKDEHNRLLPRFDEYRFPANVWFVQGTNRVLTEDPFASAHDEVRVHLVTAKKYLGGSLFLWTPGTEGVRHPAEGDTDEFGPIFRLPLARRNRHLFAFKFVDKDGNFEPDYANKLWCAQDGPEVWVHSQAAHVSGKRPERKKLTVYLVPPSASTPLPGMHLWQADSDFAVDIEGQPHGPQGRRFSYEIYSGRPYGFKFFWPGGASGAYEWEHSEADRDIILENDRSVWALEGDHELFDAAPVADRQIIVDVADRPPGCQVGEPLMLDVWVNHARTRLYEGLMPRADGTWAFKTYPEAVTSFRFRSNETSEVIPRHTLKISNATPAPTRVFVVLDRADPLFDHPVANLFQDPPFPIERPGVWERDGELRFALHSPRVTSVHIIGEWTGWRANPAPMHSCRDGTYWWAQILVSEVLQGLGRADYHGAQYKFLLNGIFERQDPAADWVESSGAESASRLTNHGRYHWRNTNWQTPGREYLIIYQVHPKRFSRRFESQGISPLRQLAEEIANQSGYLRQLGITAIQLMPVNEFAGDDSWGYGPAFYYAVEAGYCKQNEGPDDLKYFVDTCHGHGLAVLLDVVFNHAGTSDNVLWTIAQDSFFDGDTSWGAMINFDHPQVIHFFEQNLLHLRREFRVDGFRLDHTHTIVHSHARGGYVTKAGTGGGWEFLHKLRAALHRLDSRCLLVAEHLPNEWSLTRYGGPMDSQWCDDFHDRLVDACRGYEVMSRLADAAKVTHTSCEQWYEATNYPESHDEVGNVNDRLANVGGFGQGLRRNKVAAAATLLSRGIPLWFMGAESGESAQFTSHGNTALDLDSYLRDDFRGKVRAWWNMLCDLRRGNPKLQGPSPLAVHYAEGETLTFSRGDGQEYFAVLNFGSWSGWRPLFELNLPHWQYKELWNSTWPDFAVEGEDEHANGGRDARLQRGSWLQIPDYGVVILERA
jgi:1,4-alpha-glucan branching enzyme